jgi:hypothetical protein
MYLQVERLEAFQEGLNSMELHYIYVFVLFSEYAATIFLNIFPDSFLLWESSAISTMN